MTLTKRKSGFTLVELLIVIGIIAVLAAIAIPAVAGIIERTGRTRDNSNASNMSNAIEQWSLEYPLFYNDYQSGTDTDDEVGSRVRSAIKNMGYISNIEHSKLRGFAGKVVHKETFYPKGDDNELIAMRVIGILKTYLKSNNDILTPYQSDCAFWYLTDTSVIICGPFDASQAELFALAGDKGSENPSGTWINLTDYGNEATKGDAILTLGVQGMGGEISGNGTYKVGDYVKISAGASSEEFKGWYDDAGVLITTDMEHSFVIVEDLTLIARYGNGCQLILTASGQGTVSGGGQYATNSSVTVTATPTGTSAFDGWFDNGVLVSTSASYTFNINTDVNLTAKFTNIAYNVTLNSDGQGLTSGGGQYTNGTNVTVSATPSAGYKFVGWYKGSSKVSDNASYTFTMSGAVTLTAKFEAVTYHISAEIKYQKNGIDFTPDSNVSDFNSIAVIGVGEYSHGSQYTISAIVNENWAVSKITNGSTTVSTNSSYMTTATATIHYYVYLEYQKEMSELCIPTGGSYYSSNSNETYPEHTYWYAIPEVSHGDYYLLGDYRYDYNYNYRFGELGWGAQVVDSSKSKTTLSDMVDSINGNPILFADFCFQDCAITTVPHLPDTLTTMPYGFYNCDGLTNVPELPDSVYDYYYAFADCDGLTSVSISLSNSAQYLAYMFADCPNLEYLYLDGGNVHSLEALCANCTSLTTTEIYANSISDVNCYKMFSGCEQLVSINLDVFMSIIDSGGTVSAINNAFYECVNLEILPNLPNSIQSMNYAFYNCDSLHDDIYLPDSAKYLSYAFYDCDNITYAGTMNAYPTHMNFAFYGCDSLESVYFDNGVTNANSAFAECTNLNYAVLIDAVNIEKAFYNCYNLSNGYFYLNATKNMDCAFYNCHNLYTGSWDSNVAYENVYYNGHSMYDPIYINSNILTSATNAFYGVGSRVYLCDNKSYSGTSNTIPTIISTILSESSPVCYGAYVSGIKYIDSTEANCNTKINFTPKSTKTYTVRNYNSSDKTSYSCSGCHLIYSTSQDKLWDTYMYINGVSNDDSGNLYPMSYNSSTRSYYCPVCGISASTSYYRHGRYYTSKISKSLTSGTSHTISFRPYSSSYSNTYYTYLEIYN